MRIHVFSTGSIHAIRLLAFLSGLQGRNRALSETDPIFYIYFIFREAIAQICSYI